MHHSSLTTVQSEHPHLVQDSIRQTCLLKVGTEGVFLAAGKEQST